jgi:hypothetical protein
MSIVRRARGLIAVLYRRAGLVGMAGMPADAAASSIWIRLSRQEAGVPGVPVLGAIPTLSAKARGAYLGAARGALPPAVAEPE